MVEHLFFGQLPFLMKNGVDQRVEIIKILGTPTMEETKCMNLDALHYRFRTQVGVKVEPFKKSFCMQGVIAIFL